VAERVNIRTVALSRQLQRVPTAAWLVLLIVGGVLTAIIVSVTVSDKPPTISTQLTALPKGSDATHFLVRYQIDKPSHADVTCTIQAVGVNHDIVGSVNDVTPARTDTQRQTIRQISVPTSKLAVSADITDCSVTARH
jgi:hypothetical protein